ncbi:ABC transporter permease [Enterococcus rotai]|uniref:ABC transporter permease n=1 Tax=Enterococcus rotai TaxID=118060 RepID=UPI0032B5C27D
MSMKKLVSIELKKIDVKKYCFHALLANVGIAFLVLMTSFLTAMSGGDVPQITTVTVIDTLVKSVFIVWESVLIANLIIEEFRSKTVLILFSYPLDRKKAIVSKLLIIFTLIFASMIASQVFQNVLFLSLNQVLPLINYSITLSEIGITFLTTVTSILLGMLPMYVGMLNKSTVATVVSSIAIVSLTVSSGGQDGSGLITMIPVSVTMGLIGIALAMTAIKKMLSEDIVL